MQRIFAVGDMHGCQDKLVSLMTLLDIDPEKDLLLFIGDYIDRGPKTKEVVDYLIGLAGRQHQVVFLKGNHEMMFELYLRGLDSLHFLANGGQATLDSYSQDTYRVNEGIIPPSHRRFLDELKLYHETDQYIFVHAGLKPMIPLRNQSEWDMLWIREEFIDSNFDFGKRVVFGHTPFHRPFVSDNKIGIDTGAVYGNKLTCVELPALRFYSV